MSVETPKFAQFVRRILRAYGRRIAAGDDVDLVEMVAVREEFDQIIEIAVLGMRAEGHTWEYIGRQFKISPQAAYNRWGYAKRRKTV